MNKPIIKTIVSNNCFGIAMLHKLHMQFKNPMMNLWTPPCHYIKLISNFRENIQKQIIFSYNDEKKFGYPVGYIDDIPLYFTHYQNKDEIINAWKRRTLRLPESDNEILFQISERDGFSQDDFLKFSNLPYANKLLVCLNKSRYINENLFVFETGETGHEVGVGPIVADLVFDQMIQHYHFA